MIYLVYFTTANYILGNIEMDARVKWLFEKKVEIKPVEKKVIA